MSDQGLWPTPRSVAADLRTRRLAARALLPLEVLQEALPLLLLPLLLPPPPLP